MTTEVSRSHRQLFDDEIQQSRDQLIEMEGLVETAVTRAMKALRDLDKVAAQGVMDEDLKINEAQQAIKSLCFTIILTQAPVARDLREVIGHLEMATELERMGDHCKSIAKATLKLAGLPKVDPPELLWQMAELTAKQLQDISLAQADHDTDEARTVAARDAHVDEVYRQAFDALIETMTTKPDIVPQCTELILVALHLERIADRVTNIAEDLIFLATGDNEELG